MYLSFVTKCQETMAEHDQIDEADQETMAVQASIDDQIAAVDHMLLHAYATVYKLAVKYISFPYFGHDMSPTEEMMSAKTITSNLWSVLDYCCIILYHRYHGTPKPSTARQICFPCDYKNRLPAADWEKKCFIVDQLPDDAYAKFAGAFSSIQYQGEEDVPPETRAFYRLHFLRNTLTHRTIKIYGEEEVDIKQLEIFKDNNNITEGESELAIKITVPREPWNNENGEYDEVPLLDVLYEACKVVEVHRDKLLHTVDEQKFNKKYAFEITEEELVITLNNKRHELKHYKLHLECYGILAELQPELQELLDRN